MYCAAFSLLFACTGELSPAVGVGGTAGEAVGEGEPAEARTDEEPVRDGADAQAPGQPRRGSYDASASVARRVARVELDNAIRDLLGDERGVASALPEDPYSPYDNAYQGQRASGALIDSLAALAEDVSSHVLSTPALRAQLVPCTPASAAEEMPASALDDHGCFLQVVARLTRRAFRRPPSQDEVERYELHAGCRLLRRRSW